MIVRFVSNLPLKEALECARAPSNSIIVMNQYALTSGESAKKFEAMHRSFPNWRIGFKISTELGALVGFEYEEYKEMAIEWHKQRRIRMRSLNAKRNYLKTKGRHNPSRATLISQKIQEPPANKPNYVYLMKNKRNGFYKIGKSIAPRVRERTLQSEEPEIEMVFKVQVDESAERKLHAAYAEKRLRGEWFSLSRFDVRKIVKDLKSA
jgi:hypothetical protein